MEVFLLSGKSGSGKDTLANIMKDKLDDAGCRTLILHFADLVKHYAHDYYGWTGEKNIEGRALLQKIGTTIMRGFNKDYWAEIIGQFLAAIAPYDEFDVAFIPDARFINEIEVVKKWCPGTITIRIERYNDDGSAYINPAFTQEQLQHTSEVSLDNYNTFDYIVENRGSFENLLVAADLILADTRLLV